MEREGGRGERCASQKGPVRCKTTSFGNATFIWVQREACAGLDLSHKHIDLRNWQESNRWRLAEELGLGTSLVATLGGHVEGRARKRQDCLCLGLSETSLCQQISEIDPYARATRANQGQQSVLLYGLGSCSRDFREMETAQTPKQDA
jgi:hypothetical protein